MSIGRTWRNATKPECISALIERASARDLLSVGHMDGAFSAMYSQMASESQTTVPPSTRQGILPDGECLKISVRVFRSRRRIEISSNGNPLCFRTSQGRKLQDE